MRFVDAHVHLSDREYEGVTDKVIAEGKNSSVVAMVSSSVDLETSIRNLRLAETYPKMVYVALGVHPWNLRSVRDDEVQQMYGLIRGQRRNVGLVAVGEIGLDSKYVDIWDRQVGVFGEMLRLAEELDLPVIVHSRGVAAQVVDLLPSYDLRGVMLHWFSGPPETLSEVVERGYFITEGLPALYSNGIRDIVSKVPLARFLTETDGPVVFHRSPFEGRKATPGMIPLIVKAVAEIKGVDMADVAAQIVENFEAFFSVRLG
jgi:TatD DNase family protein